MFFDEKAIFKKISFNLFCYDPHSDTTNPISFETVTSQQNDITELTMEGNIENVLKPFDWEVLNEPLQPLQQAEIQSTNPTEANFEPSPPLQIADIHQISKPISKEANVEPSRPLQVADTRQNKRKKRKLEYVFK